MSSDTSELTFIRCPSCRSLVPAASRRCRMCGFSLTPTDQSEDVEMQQRREERERQRQGSDQTSYSASDQEQPESSPAQHDRAERESQDSNGYHQESHEHSHDDMHDDNSGQSGSAGQNGGTDFNEDNPLGDYLAGPPAAQPAPAPQREKPAGGHHSTPPASVKDEGPRDMATGQGAHKKAGVFRVGRDRGDTSSPLSWKAREEETSAPEENPSPSPENAEKLQQQEKPRQEQRDKVEEVQVQRSQAPEKDKEVESRQQEGRHMETPQRVNEEARPAFAPESKQKPPQAARAESVRQERTGDKQQENDSPRKPAQRQAAHSGQNSVHQTPRNGRIFGWFVSYSEADGVSYDIREGKFFLSSSSIKESDFVVKHPSVSTPHAMLSVSPRGFFIQDLMSEKGVFIKPRGESEWTREEEVVEVRHGDWVKFGELEYLVCLVAHPGAK